MDGRAEKRHKGRKAKIQRNEFFDFDPYGYLSQLFLLLNFVRLRFP